MFEQEGAADAEVDALELYQGHPAILGDAPWQSFALPLNAASRLPIGKGRRVKVASLHGAKGWLRNCFLTKKDGAYLQISLSP